MMLLGKRVVIRLSKEPNQEEKTDSGIFIVKTDQLAEEYKTADVLEVGDECRDIIKQATKAYVNTGGIDEFEWNGEKCHVVEEKMILGIQG